MKPRREIVGLCLFSMIVTSTTLVFAQPAENATKLFDKGMEMERANNFPQALTYFDKILEADPNNVKALIEKSNTLYGLRKVNEALEVLNKTLEIDPNNVKALVNKGIIFTMINRDDEAMKYINKTLEIDPNNVKALTNKGIIFGNQRKFHDALDVFNKALSIDPTDTDAIYDKLSIYRRIGTTYITPKSNFTLFFQIEIQNSAGRMVTYIESPQRLLQYLNDTTIVDRVLDAQNVTRTIIKDGKKYDVIEIRQFRVSNSIGWNGVEHLVLNDASTPTVIFLAQIHGYAFEAGDITTILWTVTRPHR